MSRTRAADDFVAIRGRMQELRRERERIWQEPERDPGGVSRRLLPPISRVPIQSGEPSGIGPFRGGRGE